MLKGRAAVSIEVREFVLFAIVGGVAAAVNILARVLFNVAVPFEAAIILAFPVALTVAFVLNRHLVFSAGNGDVAIQYWRFFLVNLVALAMVWTVSVLLVRILFPAVGFIWHAELIGHTLGVLSPIIGSYYGHKYFSFQGPQGVHGGPP